MSHNINEFPVDKPLKELITNLISSYMEQVGIELNKETKVWFMDNCAEELVANVLDCITEWEKNKLN